jgi:hypothetical protein
MSDFKNKLLQEIAEMCWNPAHREFNAEQFAEFIIRECSRTLRESKYQIVETDYYDGFNEGLEYSANRIEELFGVE